MAWLDQWLETLTTEQLKDLQIAVVGYMIATVAFNVFG